MSNEVTVDRDLMERALKIIESAHVFSISDCEVEIRAALAATPSGPEKCGHCGRRTIDPPWTISPAAPQPAPAWHDAPDEREAFEAFINAPPYYDEETAWPIWQAACARQREKDAMLCEQPNRDVDRAALAQLCAEHDRMVRALATLLGETEDSDYMSAADQRALARRALPPNA